MLKVLQALILLNIGCAAASAYSIHELQNKDQYFNNKLIDKHGYFHSGEKKMGHGEWVMRGGKVIYEVWVPAWNANWGATPTSGGFKTAVKEGAKDYKFPYEKLGFKEYLVEKRNYKYYTSKSLVFMNKKITSDGKFYADGKYLGTGAWKEEEGKLYFQVHVKSWNAKWVCTPALNGMLTAATTKVHQSPTELQITNLERWKNMPVQLQNLKTASDPKKKLVWDQEEFNAIYSVESRHLGKGYSGLVVLGNRRSNPHEKVAIKMTQPLLIPEAKATLVLEHPNIIKTFRVLPLIAENTLKIAMESADKYGGMNKPENFKWIAKNSEMFQTTIHNLTSAAVYMQNAGWSHHDLWLKNIVLSNDREVRIVDFGMAGPFEPGSKSDVFKLGVSFATLAFGYEFMNGRTDREFRHKTFFESELKKSDCPLSSLLYKMVNKKVDIAGAAAHAYFKVKTSSECEAWRVALGKKIQAHVTKTE